MKKNLKIAIAIATISSTLLTFSQALAKTRGSYIGIDVVRASAKNKTTKKEIYPDPNIDTYFDTSSKSSKVGFGAHYKYAINVNNFFIAPGLFYERIGSDAKINNIVSQWEQSLKIKDRYGVQLDIGYDLTRKFAAYIPIGYSIANYELKTKDYDDSNSFNTVTKGRKGGLSYGFGINFYPTKAMAINLEYNRTKLDIRPVGNVALLGGAELKVKTTLDVIKVGASYHF